MTGRVKQDFPNFRFLSNFVVLCDLKKLGQCLCCGCYRRRTLRMIQYNTVLYWGLSSCPSVLLVDRQTQKTDTIARERERGPEDSSPFLSFVRRLRFSCCRRYTQQERRRGKEKSFSSSTGFGFLSLSSTADKLLS